LPSAGSSTSDPFVNADPLSHVADLEALMAGWPVGSAAVATTPITPRLDPSAVVLGSSQAFPWASVSKMATALAVLIAVEEGTLSLDTPAGPPGSTVRHLLSHASGLDPESGRASTPPATLRIYSNAGYRQLAQTVAEHAGMAFPDYLQEGVMGPLGMDRTTIDEATGAGAAAAGLSGPIEDLLALGREWSQPTLISPATHRQAVSVQFPGLGGVLPGYRRFDPCDWGLGCEVRGDKRPHWTGTSNSPSTFGHFGQSGSFVWVDPAAGMVCASLSDRAFGPWAARAWPVLSDAVLAGTGAL
jgi:CubicO group peptidase (beta-lactamase class C family)